MHRPGQSPQRHTAMNPLTFNRTAQGNAGVPSGAAPSPGGYSFMPRPSPGGAAGGGATGGLTGTGSGATTAAGPFNRAFPFGASSMPPHLAAFSGGQSGAGAAGSGAGGTSSAGNAGAPPGGSLNINDFPALGGSFNASSTGTGTMSYANSTTGTRTEGLRTEDFPSLSDGFANGTGAGAAAAAVAAASQEQASAAATLQHQRLAREQNQSQTLSAARGGFGEPERNYATKIGMQQPPPGMSAAAGQTWLNNARGGAGSAPGLGGPVAGLNGTAGSGQHLPSSGDGIDGLGRTNTARALGLPARGSAAAPQPAKTPAHQVLSSPADRFGLLGLVNIIKMHDPDLSMLTMGSDLQTLGLSLDGQEPLSTTFVTPWSDNSAAAALQIEPDFHLPSCYNVHAPPAPHTKVASFSDETLFFIFYSTPGDVMQELAAQELYNRNWRFYRGGLNLWLTKEENVQPTHKDLRAEKGVYVFWDPASWSKVSREFVLAYDALEERSMGMSQAALLAANAAAAQHPSQQQQQQQQQGQQGQGQSTPAQQHQGTPGRA